MGNTLISPSEPVFCIPNKIRHKSFDRVRDIRLPQCMSTDSFPQDPLSTPITGHSIKSDPQSETVTITDDGIGSIHNIEPQSEDTDELVLDFGSIERINSAALGELAKLKQYCRSKNVALKISNVQEDVLEVFRLTKLPIDIVEPEEKDNESS